MNDIATNQTAKIFVAVLGTAMVSYYTQGDNWNTATQQPAPVASYETTEIKSTHSGLKLSINENAFGIEKFEEEVASIYKNLALRQQRLSPEFEAAIFNNLEELYEK